MRYLALLLVLFFTIPAAQAQKAKTTPQLSGEAMPHDQADRFTQRVDRRVALLTKELQLTSDQRARLRSVLVEQVRAGRALRAEAVSADEQRRVLRQRRRTTDEALQQIFTEEQYNAYRELQQRERPTPERSMERR